MKKIFSIGMIGVWLIFVSVPIGYAQEGKDVSIQKQSQIEGGIEGDKYVIGPEDILLINVWKEEFLSRTYLVRMDGKISMPLIDEIQAAGLTPLQLREVLIQKLQEFIDTPNVSVTVTEANSFKVYLSGEVRSPGVYKLRSQTSIVQIISMAGGFTEWANQKKITIIRKENGKEKRMTVNYKKIIQGDKSNPDVILRAGDMIIVP